MKIKYIINSIVIVFLLFCGCTQNSKINNITFVTTSHLDFLYEEIFISGEKLGIIHIYCEYPNYQWVGDDDEGIACVDDAARALVFYLEHYQIQKNDEILNKVKGLIEFLLHMQSDNGYFYNFIFEDYKINKIHKNSIAKADWWTWREVWALSEAYRFFYIFDADYAEKIWVAYTKSIKVLKESIPKSNQIKFFKGFKIPTWLPHETASDQAALQILCLSNYYDITNDNEILKSINHLIDGILLRQSARKPSFPYGVFFSWKNIWHGWGNVQSYALLKSYQITGNQKVTEGALNEINGFYKYLLEQKYMSEIRFKKIEAKIIISESKQFPQIAYIIRPMVFACLEAFNITNDSSYAELAGKIACWFLGDNIANKQMYNPEIGLVYDGIISKDEINLNSGAESTIEGLLTLLAVEQNPISKKIVHDYYHSRKNSIN